MSEWGRCDGVGWTGGGVGQGGGDIIAWFSGINGWFDSTQVTAFFYDYDFWQCLIEMITTIFVRLIYGERVEYPFS